jgi:hypothetical protein
MAFPFSNAHSNRARREFFPASDRSAALKSSEKPQVFQMFRFHKFGRSGTIPERKFCSRRLKEYFNIVDGYQKAANLIIATLSRPRSRWSGLHSLAPVAAARAIA